MRSPSFSRRTSYERCLLQEGEGAVQGFPFGESVTGDSEVQEEVGQCQEIGKGRRIEAMGKGEVGGHEERKAMRRGQGDERYERQDAVLQAVEEGVSEDACYEIGNEPFETCRQKG